MLLIPRLSGALLESFLFLHAPTDGRVFGLTATLGLPLYTPPSRLTLSLPAPLDISFTLPGPAVLNIAMFAAWGACHTLAAQPRFQQCVWDCTPAWLRKILFHSKDRVFSVVTAATMVPMLALWQPTHNGLTEYVFWKIPLPRLQAWVPFPKTLPWLDGELLVHDLISVGLAAYIFKTLVSDAMDELCIETRVDQPVSGTPAAKVGPKTLVTTGWHGMVRHPLYTLLLAATLATPRMTATRLTTVIAFVLYLIPGVWMEERRLESEFGEAYQDYRKEVPYQFIPYVY